MGRLTVFRSHRQCGSALPPPAFRFSSGRTLLSSTDVPWPGLLSMWNVSISRRAPMIPSPMPVCRFVSALKDGIKVGDAWPLVAHTNAERLIYRELYLARRRHIGMHYAQSRRLRWRYVFAPAHRNRADPQSAASVGVQQLRLVRSVIVSLKAEQSCAQNQNRNIVPSASVVAEERSCYYGRMISHDPWVPIQSPLSMQAVGMHDQHSARTVSVSERIDLPRFQRRQFRPSIPYLWMIRPNRSRRKCFQVRSTR